MVGPTSEGAVRRTRDGRRALERLLHQRPQVVKTLFGTEDLLVGRIDHIENLQQSFQPITRPALYQGGYSCLFKKHQLSGGLVTAVWKNPYSS